ncbi:40121_t:CDS:2 [Gigaspora margarita]|uniref:40121_t:CDS:1 n=1 Tax=Gigaspora margarita TaxID=4874 RepID=A0ABN7UYN2_GIGMA|nr:40121_t:CDS:2 [Gigaspora margarita]
MSKEQLKKLNQDIDEELIRDLEYKNDLHEQKVYYSGTSNNEDGEIYKNPWINETSKRWIQIDNSALYLTDISTDSNKEELKERPGKKRFEVPIIKLEY